jgi:hydrogenase nickel insertion protein HypA
MHESALARSILALVLERATLEEGEVIGTVRGSVAETERLEPQALAFHFAAHARGTKAEGARLELELSTVEARCKTCRTEYVPDHHVTLCPRCGSTDATLLGETGVKIDTIEVVPAPQPS